MPNPELKACEACIKWALENASGQDVFKKRKAIAILSGSTGCEHTKQQETSKDGDG